jgi:hypothetical protein
MYETFDNQLENNQAPCINSRIIYLYNLIKWLLYRQAINSVIKTILQARFTGGILGTYPLNQRREMKHSGFLFLANR